MARATIDFGIDLGTTSSCIAYVKGGQVELVRNNEGSETTPSAVWIDRKGRLHVGRRAKEQFELDEANAAIEFKLQMGQRTEKVLERTGQHLQPKELAAEVLKSLIGDVQQRLGEHISSAVITVPADFELPQCDATRQAAELAGLTFSPLLQEPISAALAYGFRNRPEKVFWLVYDFGGGTFDAAVIQLRDGLLRVVNHGGDRHLGSKLLDWAIVEELLVPALVGDHSLEDFRRGNPRWRAAFAKLKMAAEQAKIRLSRDPSAELTVEFPDGKGDVVHFEHDLAKPDVERQMEPFIRRSINICKKVLADKRLEAGHIEKVLLVGGPTLTPYLRERLLDPVDGLGIPLEFGLDPMTVVAQGAALFAGTQRVALAPEPALPDQYVLQLEYEPVGADPEPLVGGRVQASPGRSAIGMTIEFIDAEGQPPRRSGKVPLGPEGTFLANLWAAPGPPTTYRIELCDASGHQHPTAPDRLTYTFGIAVSDPPLIHSLGVAMANNEVDILIPKGSGLPVRKRVVHRTATSLSCGQTGSFLRIPVVEGEKTRRADRNRLIGTLAIAGERIGRDVPAGSEVEITIEIDQSRLLRTRAYVPLLDEEFTDVITFERGAADVGRLSRELTTEKQRLLETRHKAHFLEDATARHGLQRIEQEDIIRQLEAALAAAECDPDAADKCQNGLLDLKAAIDEVEDRIEWPGLHLHAEQTMAQARQIVQEHGGERERRQMVTLEREALQAIAAHDSDSLRRKTEDLRRLCFYVLRDEPSYWMGFLSHLEEKRAKMNNPGLVDRLFERAAQAAREQDLPGLRGAVEQLHMLLPLEDQGITGYGGMTLR
jgi:molecular chaperone DnaK